MPGCLPLGGRTGGGAQGGGGHAGVGAAALRAPQGAAEISAADGRAAGPGEKAHRVAARAFGGNPRARAGAGRERPGPGPLFGNRDQAAASRGGGHRGGRRRGDGPAARGGAGRPRGHHIAVTAPPGLSPAIQTPNAISAPPRISRGRSAVSPKKRREQAIPRGILALLIAARVPALTRVEPTFQRKKQAPEATAPR